MSLHFTAVHYTWAVAKAWVLFLYTNIRLPRSLSHCFRGHSFHFRGRSLTAIHFRGASANIGFQTPSANACTELPHCGFSLPRGHLTLSPRYNKYIGVWVTADLITLQFTGLRCATTATANATTTAHNNYTQQLQVQLQLHKLLHNYNYNALQLHYTTSSRCASGDHCSLSKKYNSNHLSAHQWVLSAILVWQQFTFPVGFLWIESSATVLCSTTGKPYLTMWNRVKHQYTVRPWYGEVFQNIGYHIEL